MLQHQHGEETGEEDAVEQEQGTGIPLPFHLFVPVDSAEPVDEGFTGNKKGRQEGFLPLVDPCHEATQRFCEDQKDGEQESRLHPLVGGHDHVSIVQR